MERCKQVMVPVNSNLYEKVELIHSKFSYIFKLNTDIEAHRDIIFQELDNLYNNDLTYKDIYTIIKMYMFSYDLSNNMFNAFKDKDLILNKSMVNIKTCNFLLSYLQDMNNNNFVFKEKNTIIKQYSEIVKKEVKVINDIIYIKIDVDDVNIILRTNYCNEIISDIKSHLGLYIDTIVDNNTFSEKNDKHKIALVKSYIKIK